MSLRSAPPVALHLFGFRPGQGRWLALLPACFWLTLSGCGSGDEGLPGREKAAAAVSSYLPVCVTWKLDYAVF